MPEIISQQTVTTNGEKVEKFVVEVDAVNKFAARQRARGYMRRNFPSIKNVMTPELKSSNTKQSTFNDLMPDMIKAETHKIEVTTVR